MVSFGNQSLVPILVICLAVYPSLDQSLPIQQRLSLFGQHPSPLTTGRFTLTKIPQVLRRSGEEGGPRLVSPWPCQRS